MKLYYMPGACSLSPHIVLRELGLPFELERVDTKAGKTERGTDYRTVNPKGYVPALEIEPGKVLTEGPAVVQFLADQKPEAHLAPPPGSFERYRLQEWLNYLTSEMHKSLGMLFDPSLPAETRQAVIARMAPKFDFLSRELQGRDTLLPGGFSVADAYLFVLLSWSPHLKIDLARWPVLGRYVTRIIGRPAVQAAMKAEGLA